MQVYNSSFQTKNKKTNNSELKMQNLTIKSISF